MGTYFPNWFIRWPLRRFRRYLENQIEFKKWDPVLSAKLDAVLLLLDE